MACDRAQRPFSTAEKARREVLLPRDEDLQEIASEDPGPMNWLSAGRNSRFSMRRFNDARGKGTCFSAASRNSYASQDRGIGSVAKCGMPSKKPRLRLRDTP